MSEVGTTMAPREAPLRVLLVDDHELLRLGIRTRLRHEADLEVVGEASNATKALELAEAVHPDVVVVDINLQDTDGLELAEQIRAREPEARVIVFSASEDERLLHRAIVAGASAYVLKDDETDDLVEAIRSVGAGRTLVEGILARYLERQAVHRERESRSLSSLTAQERRVLDLIGEGLTNRQIARALFLAEKTVRNHVSNILRKLDLSHRTQAALYLREHTGG